jgi:hypothetical protein
MSPKGEPYTDCRPKDGLQLQPTNFIETPQRQIPPNISSAILEFLRVCRQTGMAKLRGTFLQHLNENAPDSIYVYILSWADKDIG